MTLTTLSFFSAHGFGINTNIFETNVINLSIVITIVISFVGDALKELLENRKKTILENMCAADARAREVQDKLNKAKQKLDNAKQKALQIKQQSLMTAKQEQAGCIAQADKESQRLKQRKEDNLYLQQQKAIKQISKQIIILSVEKAREKLINQIQVPGFQVWVNKARFVHYRTVDKYLKNLV
jgi:F-type H+-transporting ATPase subunit b